MKVKASDYVADFLVKKGIEHVFTVVGGGAMHLNDSIGHHAKLRSTYCHHEQAAAMAAEAYARVHGGMAALCVTSGPGAINALNGVAGAYQDSIPLLVVSGQMKSSLTVRRSGLPLRTLGGQEFDIVSALDNMTKYAEMIEEPQELPAALEKAYRVAKSGRPGPCWLDIPVDVQGSFIDTEALGGLDAATQEEARRTDVAEAARHVLEKLKSAARPVLYAGNGIRLAGAASFLEPLARRLSVPVVTCWNSIDLIATENPHYCGRGGTMGDRAGNFAVQNSDLLLSIGSRLSIYQVGYDVRLWARAAHTVVNDIDPAELKKPTIRVDYPVCADAADFMQALLRAAEEEPPKENEAWLAQCRKWKEAYPVVTLAQKEAGGRVNVYAFMDALSRALPAGGITVATNGSASVVGSQSYFIKEGSRFLMNCAISSMGYGLPAAVGAAVASKGSVVCIEGDGSIMMNLQELQTIVTNRLPIKVFVINNNGYHQIRQTQTNVFGNALIGVGPESGDLGFPSFEKIARAFEMPYLAISSNGELHEKIAQALDETGFVLCEVFVTEDQKFEPKSATKRLPDGRLTSPPLEDLAPFLPREELAANMYIPLVEPEGSGGKT